MASEKFKLEVGVMENPRHRDLLGISQKIITVLAIIFTLFQLYTAFFGIFESMLQRSLHLTFALVLAVLLFKPTKKAKVTNRIQWFDWILLGGVLFSFGYVILNSYELASRLAYVTPLDKLQLVAGVIGILVLLEVARRIMGPAFAIIIGVSLLYALFGEHLPGLLQHRGYNLGWIVDHLFFTTEGIFGIPAGVSSTYIFIFILFGTFLEKTGAGDFFISAALSTMGKYRGGPAKTAVVASGFMGMLSGSAVANVVTTGAFTIPLMKKLGYEKHFAGAVEAVASSGGQFMPPIMGAAAFIIAEFTGIPYLKVAAAAVIPALLYYTSVGFMVHFEAVKLGLEGMPKSQLPNFKKVMKAGFHYLIPVVAIIYFLIKGYSPLKAGLYAIITVVAVTVLKSILIRGESSRFVWGDFPEAFEQGAKNVIEVAVACGAAGIIIGVVSLTGIGLRFSSIIIALAGGSKILGLFFTMLTAIILGMGLPTVAAYIIQAALIVPALVGMGLPLLAAHLFAFYFAIISAVTPPVALAAYAGAGVAGSDPSKTAWTAFRLAIAAFIVPYMFAFGPALILIGTPAKIALGTITALLGVVALAGAAEAWFLKKTNLLERTLLFAGALSLIKSGWLTDIAGVIIIAIVIFLQKARKEKHFPSSSGGESVGRRTDFN